MTLQFDSVTGATGPKLDAAVAEWVDEHPDAEIEAFEVYEARQAAGFRAIVLYREAE